MLEEVITRSNSGDMTEVEYLVNLMVEKQKTTSFTASNEKPSKILLCGSWDEINPCLEYAIATKGDKINLSSIIIATTDLDKFIAQYFSRHHMCIVDWGEKEYDQILVECVRSRSDKFTIDLVIEFQPTLRRLKRVRKLLEKNGTLVIPYENSMWRLSFAELMNSFTADQGILIKLTENFDDANFTKQLNQLLGCKKHTNSQLLFKYNKPAESPSRCR